MSDAPAKKSTAELPPDEAYVVENLRVGEPILRADPNNRPILCSGHIPVCTFATLFRMLGRGAVVLDPSAPRADRWFLAEEWR